MNERTHAFRDALARGEFVVSAELVLGREHEAPEAESFVRDAAGDPQGIRFISVTDLPGGNPALPPEFFARTILESELEPIIHVTGKDGNRNLIEGRLHGLAALGVGNVLALTGDAPREGLHGAAKPVFDMDSVLILDLIEHMNRGISFQMGPRKVETRPTDFLAGCAVNPFKTTEPEQMMQLYKLHLKIAAGARFVIPQLGYNLRKLLELKIYMQREGIDHVPLIGNVYVATATIAKMMQAGELPGCVVSEAFIERLSEEKKPQRLERAALCVAALRDVGFAGAHLGGFGLKHADMRTILDRSLEIGAGWRDKIEELIWPVPDEFHLLPAGADGLPDTEAEYQVGSVDARLRWDQRLFLAMNRVLVDDASPVSRFLRARLGVTPERLEDESWRRGLWYRIMGLSRMKKNFLGCVDCGDCIQDYLSYGGCSMGKCFKESRNGPCGGSRPGGDCEVEPGQKCVWYDAYLSTLAAGKDVQRFAHTFIPPRDWSLDKKDSLANRIVGIDNYAKRRTVDARSTRSSGKE